MQFLIAFLIAIAVFVISFYLIKMGGGQPPVTWIVPLILGVIAFIFLIRNQNLFGL